MIKKIRYLILPFLVILISSSILAWGEDSKESAAPIPRFAHNSPFSATYASPLGKEPKKIWAKSILWQKAPELIVDSWITPKPDTKGKFVLLEFWATWCGPCKRTIPELNKFHKKFGKDLVVIGLSDEPENVIKKFNKPKIEYSIATDPQGRLKKKLAVKGIPHAILIEPGGYVVWEGFPLLKGYELTEDVIAKILKAGKQQQDQSNK